MVAEHILSADQLKYIGCIAVEAAHFEHTIEVMLSKAAFQNSRTAKFFLNGVQMDRKLDLLKEALKSTKYDETATAKVIAAIADAKDAYAKRNAVIHGLWFPFKIAFDRELTQSDIEPTALRLSKHPDKKEHGYLAATKIKDVAKELYRVHGVFLEFYALHMHPAARQYLERLRQARQTKSGPDPKK